MINKREMLVFGTNYMEVFNVWPNKQAKQKKQAK